MHLRRVEVLAEQMIGGWQMGSVLDEGWLTRWQYILKMILDAKPAEK